MANQPFQQHPGFEKSPQWITQTEVQSTQSSVDVARDAISRALEFRNEHPVLKQSVEATPEALASVEIDATSTRVRSLRAAFINDQEAA